MAPFENTWENLTHRSRKFWIFSEQRDCSRICFSSIFSQIFRPNFVVAFSTQQIFRRFTGLKIYWFNKLCKNEKKKYSQDILSIVIHFSRDSVFHLPKSRLWKFWSRTRAVYSIGMLEALQQRTKLKILERDSWRLWDKHLNQLITKISSSEWKSVRKNESFGKRSVEIFIGEWACHVQET